MSSAAQQAHQQGQGAAARRASLAKLQQQLSADVKDWRADMSALASAARRCRRRFTEPGRLDGSHRELQLRIKQAIADCSQLQAQEKALAESLDARSSSAARRLIRMAFLAVDVGNTRLKWALYDAHEPGAAVLAHGAEFLENIDKLADGDWRSLPRPERMLGCAWPRTRSSAASRSRWRSFGTCPRTGWWPVPPRPDSSTATTIPTRLGSDRWVAMIGAWHRMLAQGAPQARWWS